MTSRARLRELRRRRVGAGVLRAGDRARRGVRDHGPRLGRRDHVVRHRRRVRRRHERALDRRVDARARRAAEAHDQGLPLDDRDARATRGSLPIASGARSARRWSASASRASTTTSRTRRTRPCRSRETVACFESLRDEGLIGAWGLSNHDLAEIRDTGPALVQNSFSLLERDDEEDVLPHCRERGIPYVPFGPLAGGWLTGKYRRGEAYPEGSRMTQRPGGYAQLRRRPRVRRARRAGGRGRVARRVDGRRSRSPGCCTACDGAVCGPNRAEHLDPVLEAMQIELSNEDVGRIGGFFRMSQVRVLDEEDVRRLLPMADCIEAMADALALARARRGLQPAAPGLPAAERAEPDGPDAGAPRRRRAAVVTEGADDRARQQRARARLAPGVRRALRRGHRRAARAHERRRDHRDPHRRRLGRRDAAARARGRPHARDPRLGHAGALAPRRDARGAGLRTRRRRGARAAGRSTAPRASRPPRKRCATRTSIVHDDGVGRADRAARVAEARRPHQRASARASRLRASSTRRRWSTRRSSSTGASRR